MARAHRFAERKARLLTRRTESADTEPSRSTPCTLARFLDRYRSSSRSRAATTPQSATAKTSAHSEPTASGVARSIRTAEHEKSQKVIQAMFTVLACGVWVVSGIERRFHTSVIPRPLVLVAEAIVVAGFVIACTALRENSYASSVIEVKPGQRVVSTGVYAIVRHPMYAGGLPGPNLRRLSTRAGSRFRK